MCNFSFTVQPAYPANTPVAYPPPVATYPQHQPGGTPGYPPQPAGGVNYQYPAQPQGYSGQQYPVGVHPPPPPVQTAHTQHLGHPEASAPPSYSDVTMGSKPM